MDTDNNIRKACKEFGPITLNFDIPNFNLSKVNIKQLNITFLQMLNLFVDTSILNQSY